MGYFGGLGKYIFVF